MTVQRLCVMFSSSSDGYVFLWQAERVQEVTVTDGVLILDFGKADLILLIPSTGPLWVLS